MQGAASHARSARTKVAEDGAVKATRRGGDKRKARCATLFIERDQRCVTPACCDHDAEALEHVGREWTWRQRPLQSPVDAGATLAPQRTGQRLYR